MKALRWIIILIHGLDVDGTEEIGFIGKLIEDKNPDINFEDLSYISYYELNNNDNIFNVEVVSGILTTTIPTPINAVENEENALTFIEDYYSLLLENKEYEIGFDPFIEGEIRGFLFYLSPYEPSVTTRNMVQKVKGSNKTKLPPIGRNQADVTSRIATDTENTNSQNEWTSFVEEIGVEQPVDENNLTANLPTSNAGLDSDTTKTNDEHSEWNSFVEDVAPQEDEVVPEHPTVDSQSQDEHSEWNSFMQDVAPQTEEIETTPPVVNTAPQDQHSEWNSFVQDVAPQEEEVEAAPPVVHSTAETEHSEWNSFVQDVAPQEDKVEPVVSEEPASTQAVEHSEWNSFVQDVTPQTEEVKPVVSEKPPATEAVEHSEWNSFVQDVAEEPQKTVTDNYATPIVSETSRDNVKEEPQRTVYKNPPTRRLQIPNIPAVEKKPEKKEDWDEFLGALSSEAQKGEAQKAETTDKSRQTQQKVFPSRIQQTQQRPFTPNKEKKQSLSPTPVPFATKDKNTNTTKTYTGNVEPRRASRIHVPPIPKVTPHKKAPKKVDVMFDDDIKSKKKKIPRPKKKSFFRKMVNFLIFVIFLSGGSFAYLWFQHPIIAQDVLKQSQKYIDIAYAKILELRSGEKPISKQEQQAFLVLERKINSQQQNYFDNLNEIAKFSQKYSNSIELQKLRGKQIKEVTQKLTNKVNELKSINHFKQTKTLLDKYQKSPGLETICINLNKKLMFYAQDTTKKLIHISQKDAEKAEFKKALSWLKNKNNNMLPQMLTTLNKSKKNMLLLFLTKHIKQKSFAEGVAKLRTFLKKKVDHKAIKTEVFILRLIHAEAILYMDKADRDQENYQNVRKATTKYKNISPYVAKNIIALQRDIQLHYEGRDLLMNGLQKANKKGNYSLSVRKKGKVYNLNGKLFYKKGRVVIINNKKRRSFPLQILTLKSLMQVFDDGVRINVSLNKRYYEIGLFLLRYKEFNEAQKAFDACNKKDLGKQKSEFYRF
ncbi:hypothetical protein [Candidatus Uabimicrobium sp. HlEnr_7]|uniref:hypothetical protein n=1 Tax=Candidatus Uabimicrobium helgolandensis TaxID=3095367 RepID=UPI0035581F08